MNGHGPAAPGSSGPARPHPSRPHPARPDVPAAHGPDSAPDRPAASGLDGPAPRGPVPGGAEGAALPGVPGAGGPDLPDLPELPDLPGRAGRAGAGGGQGRGSGVLLGPPLHVAGPEGPWEEVHDQLAGRGHVLVHTTWGQWLAAALLDPGLRDLLGRDWPRYRQTAAPAGRLRFAASRMVLKHTAAAALHLPADALDLAYRPGGRPHLRGLAGTEVSLAHTDELIVVAVSRTGPIGVDAEPVTRRPSFDLLHSYVCTPAEAAELAALPEDERTARLLHLWTLKEAYTKALGHGMRRRFAAFGFSRDEQGRTVLADEPAGAPRWTLATHLVHDRYLVSAAHRPLLPVETASRPAPHPLEETGLPPAATLGWPLPGSSGAQPT
ncbi:4'-phosphopantetheinyl transferase superfamily protein [Streptomyces sp. NPDC052287]|uniref:4'-phosphopantetheinyl transferase superfamily protein n=1 Tax=Streptomyces sp. NPDC052287 TaxID=3154950 RepID=UPI0034208926